MAYFLKIIVLVLLTYCVNAAPGGVDHSLFGSTNGVQPFEGRRHTHQVGRSDSTFSELSEADHTAADSLQMLGEIAAGITLSPLPTLGDPLGRQTADVTHAPPVPFLAMPLDIATAPNVVPPTLRDNPPLNMEDLCALLDRELGTFPPPTTSGMPVAAVPAPAVPLPPLLGTVPLEPHSMPLPSLESPSGSLPEIDLDLGEGFLREAAPAAASAPAPVAAVPIAVAPKLVKLPRVPAGPLPPRLGPMPLGHQTFPQLVLPEEHDTRGAPPAKRRKRVASSTTGNQTSAEQSNLEKRQKEAKANDTLKRTHREKCEQIHDHLESHLHIPAVRAAYDAVENDPKLNAELEAALVQREAVLEDNSLSARERRKKLEALRYRVKYLRLRRIEFGQVYLDLVRRGIIPSCRDERGQNLRLNKPRRPFEVPPVPPKASHSMPLPSLESPLSSLPEIDLDLGEGFLREAAPAAASAPAPVAAVPAPDPTLVMLPGVPAGPLPPLLGPVPLGHQTFPQLMLPGAPPAKRKRGLSAVASAPAPTDTDMSVDGEEEGETNINAKRHQSYKMRRDQLCEHLRNHLHIPAVAEAYRAVENNRKLNEELEEVRSLREAASRDAFLFGEGIDRDRELSRLRAREKSLREKGPQLAEACLSLIEKGVIPACLDEDGNQVRMKQRGRPSKAKRVSPYAEFKDNNERAYDHLKNHLHIPAVAEAYRAVENNRELNEELEKVRSLREAASRDKSLFGVNRVKELDRLRSHEAYVKERGPQFKKACRRLIEEGVIPPCLDENGNQVWPKKPAKAPQLDLLPSREPQGTPHEVASMPAPIVLPAGASEPVLSTEEESSLKLAYQFIVGRNSADDRKRIKHLKEYAKNPIVEQAYKDCVNSQAYLDSLKPYEEKAKRLESISDRAQKHKFKRILGADKHFFLLCHPMLSDLCEQLISQGVIPRV